MTEPTRLALIDTSVWVSALINARGFPAQILDALFRNEFVPVISPALLQEIAEVLRRPRFRRYDIPQDAVDTVLQLLEDRGVRVVPTGRLHLCRDPRDDFLLETAILGRAQFLISRDEDLTRDLDLLDQMRSHGIQVLTVNDFLKVLREG